MFVSSAFAGDGHGNDIYHAFYLEVGTGVAEDGSGVAEWDLDGSIGTDENKLHLKLEAEQRDGSTEYAESWVMYSRNVSTFWDIQVGVRHDTRPASLTYGVIGFEGLAPYFLETEAHLFISEDGDVSARLRLERDLLLTQRLIVAPYIEADFFARDVPELDVGAGLSEAEAGVQARYELTRAFAPYLEIIYERKFGETSSIAKSHDEENDDVAATFGIRILF